MYSDGKEERGDFTSLDEMIKFNDNASSKREKYRIVDLVAEFINSIPGTYNTKKCKYGAIRSFFKYKEEEQ